MNSILCSNGVGTANDFSQQVLGLLEYIKELTMNVSPCDTRYHNTVFEKVQKHFITFENCVSGGGDGL